MSNAEQPEDRFFTLFDFALALKPPPNPAIIGADRHLRSLSKGVAAKCQSESQVPQCILPRSVTRAFMERYGMQKAKEIMKSVS
jgi:hypothetical protein